MATPPTGGRRSGKKIIGFFFIFTALGLILSGGYILYLNYTRTDYEGYSLSNTASIKTSSYAFSLWLDREPNEPGQLKFVVKSTDPSKELFIGYAKETEANDYVRSMEYANPQAKPGQANYNWDVYFARLSLGELGSFGKKGVAPPRPPAMETFWLQKLSTQGTTTLYWDPVRDFNAPRTLIVIMNSDGSSGIQADIVLGYKPWTLSWISYLLMPAGLILGVLGFVLLRRK
jgi:hypothetical protein